MPVGTYENYVKRLEKMKPNPRYERDTATPREMLDKFRKTTKSPEK